MRGRLQPEDDVAIGVVGSRHCSHYGQEQGRRFGALLAGAGFTVMSGLARGIDGAAHEGALTIIERHQEPRVFSNNGRVNITGDEDQNSEVDLLVYKLQILDRQN